MQMLEPSALLGTLLSAEQVADQHPTSMDDGQRPSRSPFANDSSTVEESAQDQTEYQIDEESPQVGRRASSELSRTTLARSSTRFSASAATQTADEILLTGYLRRQLSVTKEGWDDITTFVSRQTRMQRLGQRVTKGMAALRRGRVPARVGDEELDLEQPSEPDDSVAHNSCAHWPQEHSICGLPLIHPASPITRIESTVMALVDATYSAFIVPIGIAFESYVQGLYWTVICDLVAGAMFNLDIFILLHTGFVITHNLKRKTVMNGTLIAWFYCRRGEFIVDVLSAVPFWVELGVIVIGGSRSHSPLIQVFLSLRLLRLIRLVRFMQAILIKLGSRSVRPGRIGKHVPSTLIYFLLTIYAACALINLLGCIWYFTARREGVENSWLTSVDGDDLSDASHPRQYVASIYYAMTTITTVGYGDITAHTAAEELVAIGIMFVGVVFFGFLIGSLGDLLERSSKAAKRASLLRGKFEDVDTWMRKRRLPNEMRTEITNYYADVWVRQSEYRDEQFFDELPPMLRSRVACYMLRAVLEKSDIFRELSPEARQRIAGRVRPRMVSPGQDLCQQGDEAECLWILQEGEILIIRNNEEVGLLEPPAVIGEAVILPELGSHRPFTFRALTWCTVWELRLSDLQMLVHVYPELLDTMVAAFKARLLQHVNLSDDAEDKLDWMLRRESTLSANPPDGQMPHASARPQPQPLPRISLSALQQHMQQHDQHNTPLGQAVASAVAGDTSCLRHILQPPGVGPEAQPGEAAGDGAQRNAAARDEVAQLADIQEESPGLRTPAGENPTSAPAGLPTAPSAAPQQPALPSMPLQPGSAASATPADSNANTALPTPAAPPTGQSWASANLNTHDVISHWQRLMASHRQQPLAAGLCTGRDRALGQDSSHEGPRSMPFGPRRRIGFADAVHRVARQSRTPAHDPSPIASTLATVAPATAAAPVTVPLSGLQPGPEQGASVAGSTSSHGPQAGGALGAFQAQSGPPAAAAAAQPSQHQPVPPRPPQWPQPAPHRPRQTAAAAAAADARAGISAATDEDSALARWRRSAARVRTVNQSCDVPLLAQIFASRLQAQVQERNPNSVNTPAAHMDTQAAPTQQ